MAQRSGNPAADPQLRDHLIASYCDRRQTFVNTARAGGDSELEAYTKAQWTPMIDTLLDGRPIEFRRYELPAGHPLEAPEGGHPSDLLELGADDVLRVVSS